MYVKTFIKSYSFFSILCLFASLSYAGKADEPSEETKKIEPPKIGNFMLPSSQQPGSLLSFGMNIVDKHTLQFAVADNDYHGPHMQNDIITPSILYGITDDFSVFLNLPIVGASESEDKKSSGLGDAYIQLEYAFYSKTTACFVDQATVVANVTFPTGSAKKEPETGFGASSFFLGATFSRATPEWLAFVADGVVLTETHEGKKLGNQFLYQGGVGRNLFNIDTRWTFAAILEATGQYTEKTKLHGVSEPGTGGNVIYITPSLWVSSKNLLIQFGVGYPAVQHLFGHQPESRYLIASNIAWTFG